MLYLCIRRYVQYVWCCRNNLLLFVVHPVSVVVVHPVYLRSWKLQLETDFEVLEVVSIVTIYISRLLGWLGLGRGLGSWE